MIYFTFFVTIIYYLRFIFYFRKMFPPKKTSWLNNIFLVIISILCYLSPALLNIQPFSILLIWIPMILGLKFLTGMKWMQALYGGCVSILVAYSFRGIIATICMLTLFKGCNMQFLDQQFYYTMIVLSLPISILFFEILRKTIVKDEKLKQFLNSYGQLKLVIVYELATIIYIIMANHGRFLAHNEIWYTTLICAFSVISLGILMYFLYKSIHVVNLLEYEIHTQILEKQFDRQMRHYKSYQKYTESFKEFKHDYNFLMLSVNSLINAKENEKAIELINSIHDTMQKKVLVHKEYSRNIILDAMLQDLANICEENNIYFSPDTYIHKDTNLSSLDTVRVFSNIINNAIEACFKVPLDKRFIEITSGNKKGWFTIEVVNSFNGNVVVSNSEIETSKADKDFHGLGIRIVKDIIEELGGFVLINPDNTRKIFKVKIHIPKLNDKSIENNDDL